MVKNLILFLTKLPDEINFLRIRLLGDGLKEPTNMLESVPAIYETVLPVSLRLSFRRSDIFYRGAPGPGNDKSNFRQLWSRYLRGDSCDYGWIFRQSDFVEEWYPINFPLGLRVGTNPEVLIGPFPYTLEGPLFRGYSKGGPAIFRSHHLVIRKLEEYLKGEPNYEGKLPSGEYLHHRFHLAVVDYEDLLVWLEVNDGNPKLPTYVLSYPVDDSQGFKLQFEDGYPGFFNLAPGQDGLPEIPGGAFKGRVQCGLPYPWYIEF